MYEHWSGCSSPMWKLLMYNHQHIWHYSALTAKLQSQRHWPCQSQQMLRFGTPRSLLNIIRALSYLSPYTPIYFSFSFLTFRNRFCPINETYIFWVWPDWHVQIGNLWDWWDTLVLVFSGCEILWLALVGSNRFLCVPSFVSHQLSPNFVSVICEYIVTRVL